MGRALNLPPPLTELASSRNFLDLAGEKRQREGGVVLHGRAGRMIHFIPAAVDAVGLGAAIYTAYTP